MPLSQRSLELEIAVRVHLPAGINCSRSSGAAGADDPGTRLGAHRGPHLHTLRFRWAEPPYAVVNEFGFYAAQFTIARSELVSRPDLELHLRAGDGFGRELRVIPLHLETMRAPFTNTSAPAPVRETIRAHVRFDDFVFYVQ